MYDCVISYLFSSLQVLITIYWLGRRAQCDHFYDGPYLNFKAFEGLLGTALYKVKLSKWVIIPLCTLSCLICAVMIQKLYFLVETGNSMNEILFYSHCPEHFCILSGMYTMCRRMTVKGRGASDCWPLKPKLR